MSMSKEDTATVDDLGVWRGGSTPYKAEPMFWRDGSVPWVSPKDMGTETIRGSQQRVTQIVVDTGRLFLFPRGSVAVVFRSGVLRKRVPVAYGEVPFTINQDLKAVVTHNNVDERYAYHVLTNLDSKIRNRAVKSGTTVESVDLRDFLRLEIFLPDRAEQRWIAEILDTADEAIQKTEVLIAKLKQMKAGLLHDFLTRGIDANGELRPKDCPKQTLSIGEVPADWDVEECESLCHSITVGIVIRPTQYYTTTGVPVLRSTNVTVNGINGSDMVYMSEESNLKMAKSMLRTGDVVTVRTGYPGTSCVVSEKYDRSNCVDILISRPTSALLPAFLAMWINSDFGKGQVLRQQTGLAQQHFNVGELKELLVAKPDPTEQRRIMERLHSAQNRIDEESKALGKLKLLKAGLMHDLLTGKKRVSQPAPASV